MPRRAIPPGTQLRYIELRKDKHVPRKYAAEKVGISYPTALNWDKKFQIGPYDPSVHGVTHDEEVVQLAKYQVRQAQREERERRGAGSGRKAGSYTGAGSGRAQDAAYGDRLHVPDPIPLDQLSPEAARGLEDLTYFARRHFGALLLPVHEEIVREVRRLLATPYEEYLLENIAPGAGKTFFARIVAAQLTCQDRTIRGLMGSAVQTLATRQVSALRTVFERTIPQHASLSAKRAGIAVDAEATLAMDYGRFAPSADDPNIWQEQGFRVAQHSGSQVSDKELTWLAVGFDTRYIGTRVNVAIWDDPHDKTKVRTLEGREKMAEDWSDVAESRLETGGLLWLIQQRLGPGDLTSHCLQQRTADDENEGEERPVYHQLRFRAHYEDRCKGWTADNPDHQPDAKPYPEGCLLFPRKLHFRLLDMKRRKPNFRVVYQQEDADPEVTKLKPVHIYGGRDPDTHIEHVGCLDPDRAVCEKPKGIEPPWWSIVSVDPSPTRFWAFGWWLYHPASGCRFLLDLERRRMGADDLIDRIGGTGEFTGLMPEWQRRSESLGMPVTHWIYERNAAQRFALKFNHVQDWLRQTGVYLVSHDTYASNKHAPEEAYGFDCIWPHFKEGRVRIPWSHVGDTRTTSLKLIDEALAYPDGSTDDTLMEYWFVEWNLPRLARPTVDMAQYARADWVRGLGALKVGA